MKCKEIQEKDKINLQLFIMKKSKEKGITLIALVVTIIILLILAGVTLNITLSGDGLFSMARKAATDYNQKAIEEKLQLMYAEKVMEDNDSNSNVKTDVTSVLEEMAGGEITEKDIEEFNKLLEPYNEEVKGVTSADELTRIGQDEEYPIDGVYVQLSDIDEITTPIGSGEKTFKGVYNGNGKSIKKLEIIAENENVGMFAVNEGTIRNVTIDDCSINSDFKCVGGIVGTNLGVIDGCTILEGEINTGIDIEDSSSNGTRVGGICGEQKSGGMIKNCKNSSNVMSPKSYVGGICGWSSSGNVVDCTNNGEIHGTCNVGGICGCVSYSGSTENTLISNCKNFGKIMEIEDRNFLDWTHGCFGGILGGGYSGYKIEHSSNYGNVETKARFIGGLAGDLRGTIIESENNAYVKGNIGVGGLVGRIYEQGIIRDSKNVGEVSGTSNYGRIYGQNLKTENDNVINCGENS